MSVSEPSSPPEPRPEDINEPPPLALIPQLQQQRKLTIVSPSLDQILRRSASGTHKGTQPSEHGEDYLPALAEAVSITTGGKARTQVRDISGNRSHDAPTSPSAPIYSDHSSLFQPLPSGAQSGQEIILGTDTDAVEVVIGETTTPSTPVVGNLEDNELYENMVVGPTMTKLVAAAQCQESEVTILGSTEFEISLYVPGVEVSTKLIKDFQKETGYKFAIAKARRTFGQVTPDISLKTHRILWRDLQDGKRDPQIEFDGVPFIVLGEKRLDCEHGKRVKKPAAARSMLDDTSLTESPQQSMEISVTEAGSPTELLSVSSEDIGVSSAKRRRCVMSKKFDCPAKICLRDIARFPDYKVKADTEHHRQVISRRLRRDMDAGEPIHWERRIYIRLPTELRHQCHAIRGFRRRRNRRGQETAPEKLWQIGKLNHVAIAVNNLETASKLYRDVFGAKVSEPHPQPDHGVYTVFVELGETKIELISPLGNKSPIEGFLKKNNDGGIHHICLEVSDIHKAIKDISANDVRVLDPTPKIGAHNKPVVFLHPKDCGGVLVELEQQ